MVANNSCLTMKGLIQHLPCDCFPTLVAMVIGANTENCLGRRSSYSICAKDLR